MRKTPLTFGVLAIVFGSLELLRRLSIELLFRPLWTDVASEVSQATGAAMRAVARHTQLTNWAFIVMSIALIVIGVGLRMRQPWSRPASIAWGIAALAFLVGNTAYTFAVVIPAQEAARAANFAAREMHDSFSFLPHLGGVTAAMSTFFFAIFPTLLLVFLARHSAAADFPPAEGPTPPAPRRRRAP